MLVIKNVFYRNCFEIGEQIYGSMRLIGLAVLLCFMGCEPAPVYGQSVIRNLAWELNTSRPAQQEWQLVRGETVDLECRYLSGAAAMDVRGASVVLHCITNGMAAGYSYQVTGRVGRVTSTNLASVGWVTVRVRPGSDLPPNVKSMTFTLETQLNSARNLVASGVLRLSGDPTGASPASVPLYGYDPAGSAQVVSNALALGLWGLDAKVNLLDSRVLSPTNFATAAQYVSVTGALAQVSALSESNRVALSNLPPPTTDALRLMTPNGLEWRDATGAVWRVSVTTQANIRCTLSPDFGVLLQRDWYFRPAQLVYVCAPGTLWQEDFWSIYFNVGDEGLFQVVDTQDNVSWVAWASGPPTVAEAVYNPEYTSQGTATFEWLITTTTVTQQVDTVALRSDLIGLGGGSSTNCVFSTSNGTNYVPVWSESFGTYLIQGIPQ